MNEENTDVVIVGGGPGGSSSAIAFRNRGFNVTLLEKGTFPKDKVCGELIAPLGVKELERLNILDAVAARANEIRRIILYSNKGASNEIAYHEGEFALAITRMELDQLLFNMSREKGANTIEGFAVEEIEKEKNTGFKRIAGRYVSSGKRKIFRARIVINATGVRGIGKREKTTQPPLYAFKAYLRGIDCGDATEMFFYRGGYGGLISTSNGMVTLAFQIEKSHFRLLKEHPVHMLEAILSPRHPILEKLAHATVVKKWGAIGVTHLGAVRQIPGTWNIGDSSKIIDPFTGLGISLALQGGRFLGETLDPNQDQPAYDVKTALNGNRMLLITILRHLIFRPVLFHMMIKGSPMFPWLGRTLINKLHS